MKNTKIITGLMLLLILASNTGFAQEFSRDYILQGQHLTELGDVLGESCYSNLSKFYKEGGRIHSDIIFKKSKTLPEFHSLDEKLETTRAKITKTSKGFFTFFHYTKASALIEQFGPKNKNRDEVHQKLKNGGYEKIMAYLKSPDRSITPSDFSTYRVHPSFLYVSSCPKCSSNFGNIQLSFTMSKETRVIKIEYFDNSFYRLIESELSLKYPQIMQSCSFAQIGPYVLEDSGIDLILYDESWYQLTNLQKVINSDIIIMPSVNYAKVDQWTARRAQDRIYSTNALPAPRVSPPVPTPPKEAASIKVTEASWLSPNDSLLNAQTLCNGKTTCSYKVHERFIPTISYKYEVKPFTIKWRCSSQESVKFHTIPADARGKVYTLTCE